MCIFALAPVVAGAAGAGTAAAGAGLFTAANVFANIAVISGVVGGVSSAYSQYQTGKYNNQVAANNKIIADRQAEDSLRRGRTAEAEHRRKVEDLKGSQKVAFGAGNIQLGSGTPLDVLEGTAVMGEIDALTIRDNARREAYGYQVQGMNAQAQGRLDKYQGTTGAVGSLLTSAGSVAGKWYDLKKGT